MERAELSRMLALKLGLSERIVSNVLALADEGATVPFIARYRKELTGSMDEVAVKSILDNAAAYNALSKRKEAVIQSLTEQKKLTPELLRDINACTELNSLEDLYLPYRPKRKTRASVARERGLEPLAAAIMAQRIRKPGDIAMRFVKGEIRTVDDALAGASDIIAEWVSERISNRNRLRLSLMRRGRLEAKAVETGTKYDNYADYSKPLQHVAPHHYLAIRRGESEKILKVYVRADEEGDIDAIARNMIRREASQDVARFIYDAVADSYKRLLLPSITNEMLGDLKERSDKASLELFSDALRQILLYPPVGQVPVLSIDPGFRTGCKIVALSGEGDLLDKCVIYPVAPHNRVEEAARKVKSLLGNCSAKVIALGDGTASRETEAFLRTIGLSPDIKIEKVSEQGASIYSASELARKEFPDLDLTFRSAVSIGRRLQDPLAELVKIDPKSIGVGQYQHDVNQTLLKDSLDFVVERCVNEVGVNVNTASAQLLAYVSGIGPQLAGNIVTYRAVNGPFPSRAALRKVPRLGDKAFEQCSGFLRVPGAKNPLDNSAVHPERYKAVEMMAKSVGCTVSELIGNDDRIEKIDCSLALADGIGEATFKDILSELRKPGRDPREAIEADWQSGTLGCFEDLHIGMILNGKVVNLTAFGAFVDLGIKENGLIHISQLTRKRVQSAAEVLKMWQIVKVKIIGIDDRRRRISLTMLDVE